jgi:hypothetical protein
VAVGLLLLGGVLYLVAAATQTALTVWLFLATPSGQPAYNEKKNQMMRMVILSAILMLPVLFSTFTTYYGIVFWVFIVVTLWPNALVGYPDPPATAAATGNFVAAGAVGGLVPTGAVDAQGNPIYVQQPGVDTQGQPYGQPYQQPVQYAYVDEAGQVVGQPMPVPGRPFGSV